MNLKSSLLLRRSTIYISNMESIDHISALSKNTIWVSNPTLFQEVNCEGKVTRTIKDIGSYLAFSGIHSFTMYGDLIYIGIGCLVTREKETRVKSLQFDGSKKTLYTTDMELGCLYSSHINGDILIGVTNLRNFLFVRYTEAVKVIRCDYTGKKIQEIEFKHQDHTERLYKDPRYITENRINGNILVSDWEKDALVVVDKSGRHLFDYRGDLPSKKFFGPKAVCTDIHGRILLIHLDYDTDRDASTCISLLDQDGNFISRLLENDFAVHKSTALCVDEANNLYFGCKNRIEVFKLSDSH